MHADQTSDSSTTDQPWDLRLLLVCHAEAMDVRQAEHAAIDTGLTARGWQQTDILAAWLVERFTINALVSAPELRNRLTAQRIGQAIGLPVTIHRDLPGEPYGASVGADDATLSIPRAIQHAPKNFDPERDDDDAAGLDQAQGELAQFCHELNPILETLSEAHPGETVAIVMSPGLISATISCMLGTRNFAVVAEATSIAEMRLRHGRWIIYSINRHEHQPTPPGKKPAEGGQTVVAAESLFADLSTVIDVYNRAAIGSAGGNDADAARLLRARDLLQFAKLPQELSILDVGAGSGSLTIALAEAGAEEVIGIRCQSGHVGKSRTKSFERRAERSPARLLSSGGRAHAALPRRAF